MIDARSPRWFARAREVATKAGAPIGTPFAAKRAKDAVEIHLYDAIGLDPWTGTGIDPNAVSKEIAAAKGASELVVRISSPGGSVFDGLNIYNAIRAFNGKRTVYVDGVAASIASIIALAGDRVITNDGAMWMVHDPWGGLFAMGTADEIEDSARKTVNALRKVRENLVDIYVRQTGKPVSQVSEWMTAETWMTAKEALAAGLTDEVEQDSTEPDEDDAKKARSSVNSPARLQIAAMEMDLRGIGPRKAKQNPAP